MMKMKNNELSDFRRKKLGFIFQEFNLIRYIECEGQYLTTISGGTNLERRDGKRCVACCSIIRDRRNLKTL